MPSLLAAALFVLVGVVVVVAISRRRSGVDRFDWLATRSTARYCEMVLGSGTLYYRGGGSIYVPPGPFSNRNWGETNTVHVVGPDLKRLPDRLEIAFYSPLEDQVYGGSFELPYERILKLFKEGFFNPFGGDRGHVTYETIIVGMAPGGVVTVWLRGRVRQTEVFFGHATPGIVDWHKAADAPAHVDRQERRTVMLRRALDKDPAALAYQQHPPLGLWDRLHRRYMWKTTFEQMPQPRELSSVEYRNGEHEYIALPPTGDAYASRAIPAALTYVMPRSSDDWYELKFDEAEVLTAFERMGANGEQLELVIIGAADNTGKTRVVVRSQQSELELREVAIR